MRAFAHAHPFIAAIAAFYAVCFLGLSYCVQTAGAEPADEAEDYYP